MAQAVGSKTGGGGWGWGWERAWDVEGREKPQVWLLQCRGLECLRQRGSGLTEGRALVVRGPPCTWTDAYSLGGL